MGVDTGRSPRFCSSRYSVSQRPAKRGSRRFFRGGGKSSMDPTVGCRTFLRVGQQLRKHPSKVGRAWQAGCSSKMVEPEAKSKVSPFFPGPLLGLLPLLLFLRPLKHRIPRAQTRFSRPHLFTSPPPLEFPEPRPGLPSPHLLPPSPDLPSGSQMKGEVVDCPILRCASYRMGPRERLLQMPCLLPAETFSPLGQKGM